MSMDTFLRLDGIPGESTHQQFAHEIEVLDWSWGIESTGAGGFGGGAGVGRVRVRDLVLRHDYDQASPLLATRCIRGTRIRDARLSVVRPSEHPFVVLQATLRDLTVLRVDIDAEVDGERPNETVALRFEAATIEYRRQRDDGTSADPVVMEWDARR